MLDEGLVGLVKILDASDIVRIFSLKNINYGTINSRLWNPSNLPVTG